MKYTPDILTLFNSAAVGMTYFQSVNDFLSHNEVIDHQLTDCRNAEEIALLSVGAFFCGLVILSNQQGISLQTAKFLNGTLGTEFKKTQGYRSQALEGFGSVAKALIASSSLLSSIRDVSGDWIGPSVVVGLLFLGNLGATWTSLVEHQRDHKDRPYCLGWSLERSKYMAKAIGVCYSLSQAALYSNALFSPFLLTGIISKRPGFIKSDDMGRYLMLANLYPWAEFVVGTYKSTYRRAQAVLGSGEKIERLPPTTYGKWRGAVASTYRTFALMAAVFCVVYLLSGENPVVAALAAATSSLAAPGVFALLYPVASATNPHRLIVNDDRAVPLINGLEQGCDREDSSYQLI